LFTCIVGFGGFGTAATTTQPTGFKGINMRQVQPEMLPKNSNFSSCFQNIKLKNSTT
jgi:hypothetical protein